MVECGKANSLIKPGKRIQSNIHTQREIRLDMGALLARLWGQQKETHSRLITQKSTTSSKNPWFQLSSDSSAVMLA